MSQELDTLKAELEADGWKFVTPTMPDTGVDWVAIKAINDLSVSCIYEGKAPHVIVTPYSLDSRNLRSVEISLTGGLPTGQWIEFKVFCVSAKEVLDNLQKVSSVLTSCWNNACYEWEMPDE